MVLTFVFDSFYLFKLQTYNELSYTKEMKIAHKTNYFLLFVYLSFCFRSIVIVIFLKNSFDYRRMSRAEDYIIDILENAQKSENTINKKTSKDA